MPDKWGMIMAPATTVIVTMKKKPWVLPVWILEVLTPHLVGLNRA